MRRVERQKPTPIESEQHEATTRRTPFDTAHPSTSRRVSASSKALEPNYAEALPPEKNVDDRLSFGQSSSDQRSISRIESRARKRTPGAQEGSKAAATGEKQPHPSAVSAASNPGRRGAFSALLGNDGGSLPPSSNTVFGRLSAETIGRRPARVRETRK